MITIDTVVDLIGGAVSSPWIYLAIFALATIDGFFPVVPSESLVITCAVFAASDGRPNIVLVVLVAAVGAFAGDHIAYLIGRRVPLRRWRRAYDRMGRLVERRGGMILLVARYVPGGRTAATMTMGAVGYPLRTFSLFDAAAAASWGVYSGLVGYLGGAAFEDDPVKGLLLGLGMALAIAGLIELVRHLRARGGMTSLAARRSPEKQSR